MEFMIGYQKATLIEGVVQLVVSMAKFLILVGGVLVVIGTYPEAFLMKSMGIVLKNPERICIGANSNFQREFPKNELGMSTINFIKIAKREF